jgi:D-arabinose 1-dehydrogenase-like Zn-dependent alcohol dehydrogenase
MARMKAVQVPKAGADFEIVEREIPQPGAGQVRIRVEALQRCVHQGGQRARHRLSARAGPMIEKFPLAKASEAYARMMSGKAEFRVVLTM